MPHLADPAQIAPLRDAYRAEMNCQIIHDSIHRRPGWTREYVIESQGEAIGYGSLAIAGPWRDAHTLYEFYLLPAHRLRTFHHFEAILAASGAVKIETQTNDPHLTPLLHTYCDPVEAEAIVFADALTTQHAPPGAAVRQPTPADAEAIRQFELADDAQWIVTQDGAVAGAGDILYHYNRPYGDVYMKIAEPFRRRGLGAFLVQELKRICRAGGSVPAARCNVNNGPSRRTLQAAGFVPCGNILAGFVKASARS